MKARTDSIPWVRTPHQDRSRRTLERLLDAAETLLQERGFENVSVAEIAQAAESSVGAFYARFRDKNGLLHHLHERFCEEAITATDAFLHPELWKDAGAAAIVSEVVKTLGQIYRTRSGMFRAFMVVGQTDGAFLERDRRLLGNFLARLTGLLLERRREIGHPHPEFAIAFGIEMISAVLRDRLVMGGDQLNIWPPVPTTLEGELTRAYLSFLDLRPSATEECPPPRVRDR